MLTYPQLGPDEIAKLSATDLRMLMYFARQKKAQDLLERLSLQSMGMPSNNEMVRETSKRIRIELINVGYADDEQTRIELLEAVTRMD